MLSDQLQEHLGGPAGQATLLDKRLTSVEHMKVLVRLLQYTYRSHFMLLLDRPKLFCKCHTCQK